MYQITICYQMILKLEFQLNSVPCQVHNNDDRTERKFKSFILILIPDQFQKVTLYRATIENAEQRTKQKRKMRKEK